ncbi:hypothetical protein EVAR_34031_1 [Eumeta japonica]|uniref:Uncharacterized protein n=1 Tax=Eumeta variegata TaxID=151549 RepID=A0A4C1VR75_EUMVA|nr:hypothetical protein EVAR_34031_1 [Eumeta japonica]
MKQRLLQLNLFLSEWKGRVPFTFMSVSLSLLGGLTMPEWKGRVPLTRSHCERITGVGALTLSPQERTLRSRCKSVGSSGIVSSRECKTGTQIESDFGIENGTRNGIPSFFLHRFVHSSPFAVNIGEDTLILGAGLQKDDSSSAQIVFRPLRFDILRGSTEFVDLAGRRHFRRFPPFDLTYTNWAFFMSLGGTQPSLPRYKVHFDERKWFNNINNFIAIGREVEKVTLGVPWIRIGERFGPQGTGFDPDQRRQVTINEFLTRIVDIMKDQMSSRAGPKFELRTALASESRAGMGSGFKTRPESDR